MDEKKEYLSPDKHGQLQQELIHLKTVDRKGVAERLEYAKSLGDLSENAEYQEARDQQADIEDRLREVENILKNAIIVSASSNHGPNVTIGSIVVVKKAGNGDGETTYTIVGSEEADMLKGKISHQSPIGNSLLGKKKGDAVLVTTPKGEVKYSIIDIK